MSLTLLTFSCTYFYPKNKSSEVKLVFSESSSRKRYLEFAFSRVGTIQLELENLVQFNYDKKENLLRLELKLNIRDESEKDLKLNQKKFSQFLYEKMTNKSAQQKKENTLERISNVFSLEINDQEVDQDVVEFSFQGVVTGNWETHSKKFIDIFGSFSKVEDKPILYSIGRDFFFDRRDATASLNGYLYQVDLALNYWIDTLEKPEQCVMLEFGEDVAILPINFVNEIENFKINVKSEKATESVKSELVFEQAKLYKNMIQFNSDCICDIFFNYFTTEGKSSGLNIKIKYRFTTSNTIENIQKWRDQEEFSVSMFKEMIEQHDKKRASNSTKTRYKREKEDWDSFVNYCKQNWNRAVKKMSELEFVENMTPETLSGIIETKLKAHVGSGCDITQLRNTLFGMVKSQLLENRDEKSLNPKMLHPKLLRDTIDQVVHTNESNRKLMEEIELLKKEIEQQKH